MRRLMKAAKKDNPMTLLDFMIIVGPITIVGLAGLIAYLLK